MARGPTKIYLFYDVLELVPISIQIHIKIYTKMALELQVPYCSNFNTNSYVNVGTLLSQFPSNNTRCENHEKSMQQIKRQHTENQNKNKEY